MNEKQLAERLRQIDQGYFPGQELRRLADELDPPKPEPGTPIHVWLIDNDYHGPRVEMMGWSRQRGIAATKRGGTIHAWDEIYRWEPLNILGPLQVAVDVPPVGEWPRSAEAISLYFENARGLIDPLSSITRAEAKRREERDE